jgi:TetR/AcrR family transcriptional regulator, tetracycline repressor protein
MIKMPDETRLSRAVVADRALALADAHGLEALTIRRLAKDLGVTPMALYWHFRSKEELLAALCDRVWAELDLELDPAAEWPAQMRGLLESLVATLRAHPAASNLVMAGEKLHSQGALEATEAALEVLQRGGFDVGHASEIARSALWIGLMLVTSDAGAHPASPPEERAELQRQAMIRLSMLPPDRFPHLVAAAGPMTACDGAEFHYRLGVEMFIAGLVALAPTTRTSRACSTPQLRP